MSRPAARSRSRVPGSRWHSHRRRPGCRRTRGRGRHCRLGGRCVRGVLARQLDDRRRRRETERGGRDLDAVARLVRTAGLDRVGLFVERRIGDQARLILGRQGLSDAPDAGDRQQLRRGGRGRRGARSGRPLGGRGGADDVGGGAAVTGDSGVAADGDRARRDQERQQTDSERNGAAPRCADLLNDHPLMRMGRLPEAVRAR